MAFSTFVLNGKSILALVMAESTRLAVFHVCHAGLDHTRFEGENLGVAIGAFIGLQMELVAECGFATGGLPGYFARFHSLVTFIAVAGRGEGFLAVVAGAAGFALGHIIHGCLAGYTLVRECFGMAVLA